MPRTEAADRLHAMKYRGPGETFNEAVNRVSFGLKDDDAHYHALRDIFGNQRFLPGGRIQGAIGATRLTTPYNCFVSGSINDSLVDGTGSIMSRLHEAAGTMKLGGGIGYDFSELRPSGDRVKKIESNATGPVSFMQFFNTIGLGVASSGHRRGAQMGILRVDHPDIEAFIAAKQTKGAFEGFNISVGITDEFMEAALGKKSFDLKFGGAVYKTIDAEALWEKIMRSTWDWAEPGCFFVDTVNRMNNLWYCETIAATNPCGEQPLPPYGACLLGSFNLTKYLVGTDGGYMIAWDHLAQDIPVVVRAMDNVVDRARYPLPAQRSEAVTKRRMGLGVTGLANALEACGHPYGCAGFIELEGRVLSLINNLCYQASAMLAKEKGTFPLYDPTKYLAGGFIGTLNADTRALIGRYGMRNSHLTSIAPTGTISMCADNVSSGIEPVFSYEMQRPIHTPDGLVLEPIKDYGVNFLGHAGTLSKNVTAQEHVDVLITAQKHVDSAVSKTINMDGRTMPWAEFKNIYRRVWENGGKGCTTFNISGLRMALLTDGVDACEWDPTTGKKDC